MTSSSTSSTSSASRIESYRVRLEAFTEKVLAARSYYELGASGLEFRFPEPGVKTKAKATVRVTNMSFYYTGKPRPQIRDITIQRSLSSHITVIGPKGAGKSTQVNVLTCKLVGNVYKHPNIRIAYIKQHAYAHVDNHLDKAPSEYIQWRFHAGEDRETMDRANTKITKEDEQGTKNSRVKDSQCRVISIHSRGKWKNSCEYEGSFEIGNRIRFKGEKWTLMSTADNAWIPRTELIATHSMLVAEDRQELIKNGQLR